MTSRRVGTSDAGGRLTARNNDTAAAATEAASSITRSVINPKKAQNAVEPKIGSRLDAPAQPKSRPRSGYSRNSSIGGSIYASTILSMDEDNEAETDEFLQGGNTLNDQQWILQRKKIGLSRKTNRAFTTVSNTQYKTKNALNFVKSFKRKECVHFVPDPSRHCRPIAAGIGVIKASPCFCGAPEDEHRTRASHIHESKYVPVLVNETIMEEDERSSTTSSIAPFISQLFSQDVNSIGRQENWMNNSDIHSDIDHILSSPVIDELNVAPSFMAESHPNNDGLSAPPSQTLTTTPKSNSDWSDANAIQEFPTNAFGQVDFITEDEGTLKPAKYIRLSDTTPMAKVKELLIDHWGLFRPHRPHLALSLIGGAKNFRMEGRKRETFKAGLIKAAKSTNALILTGGSNAGAMKLVGEAVREGQFMVQDGNKLARGLKLMGLCSWGYIKARETFVNPDPSEFNSCTYNSNMEVLHGDNVPLNGDHTHFIMIDDGSRYRFFGKSTDFITRFETMVRDQEPMGLGIPIVTLLLEGGKDAIRIVKDRLREGIACVAIEGSGRAADIISYAYKNAVKDSTGTYTLKEGHIVQLNKMVDENYGAFMNPESYRQEQLKSIMNWLFDCIKYSDLITIFDIRRETQLDKKILSALLKGADMNLHNQLFLAMVWDRVDIAEEKILVHESIIGKTDLDDIMLKSLLLERVKFIELLFVNGFMMRNFLTVEKLKTLYNETSRKSKELHNILKSLIGINVKELHLRHIHKLLVYFFKDHNNNFYRLEAPGHYDVEDSKKILFEEVYVELFIWALLTNKQMLVEFFWTRCSQPLLMAIIAATISSRLSLFYSTRNTEFSATKKQQKVIFQDRANKLIAIAFASDPNKCLSLLERRNKRWGDRNIMELGYIGHLRTFIANPSCQMVTQSAWKRGFTRLPWFACLLCLFFPFLVWTPLVRFQPGLGDDGGDLNMFQKLYVFYKSPIAKYTGSCISFASLLVLYSYVAIFGYRYQYQIPEIVLYVWICILIVEECRQVAAEPSKSFKGKLLDYFDSVWNKFDFAIYSICIFTFVLKNFRPTYWVSRIFFAFNGAMFYVRVFRIYHASFNLGPKLVIFHRMIPEIVTFMLLLIVFILAYGVSSQAIIDPYREFKLDNLGPLLFNIFFLPYWQMYGELQLESIAVRDSTDCAELFSGSNSTNLDPRGYCLEPDIENLADYNYVIPFFLSVYLLIGNVMLLNLLIAIFTSVFEEVHENSKDVWKWEMYRLVAEYDKWPGLAPPFVILEDIFKFFKSVWKVTCRRKKEDLDTYMKETMETLRLFERDCMTTFMAEEAKNKEESLERRLHKLEEKTEQLLEMFEDAPDDRANWGKAISTDKKLYKTQSDDESTDEDLTDADVKKSHKKITFGGESTSRARTGRSLNRVKNVEQDLKSVQAQLDRMEERRKSDQKILEEQTAKTNAAIEDALKNLTEKVLETMKKTKNDFETGDDF